MCLSPCFSEFGNHLFHTFVTQLTSNDDQAMVTHFPSQFVILYTYESAELKGKYVKQRPKQIPSLKTMSVDRNGWAESGGGPGGQTRPAEESGPTAKNTPDADISLAQSELSLLRHADKHKYTATALSIQRGRTVFARRRRRSDSYLPSSRSVVLCQQWWAMTATAIMATAMAAAVTATTAME